MWIFICKQNLNSPNVYKDTSREMTVSLFDSFTCCVSFQAQIDAEVNGNLVLTCICVALTVSTPDASGDNRTHYNHDAVSTGCGATRQIPKSKSLNLFITY